MKVPLCINFFPFSSEEDVVPDVESDASFVEEAVDDCEDNWRILDRCNPLKRLLKGLGLRLPLLFFTDVDVFLLESLESCLRDAWSNGIRGHEANSAKAAKVSSWFGTWLFGVILRAMFISQTSQVLWERFLGKLITSSVEIVCRNRILEYEVMKSSNFLGYARLTLSLSLSLLR